MPNKPKTCACGCGRKLDMVGASKRKFWYGHEKIGEDNFWFYTNHPPECLCGCGEPADWDEVNLMWKEFKNCHDKKLADKEKAKLRRRRKIRSSRQLSLFSFDDDK